MAYIPDHEISLGSANFPNDPEWTSGFEIAENADLLFHDSQYRSTEYANRIGWGHSSIADSIAFAKLCHVKKLALFHHDPGHTDKQLNQLFKDFTDNKKFDFEITMCAEGDVFQLD
jgi:ribonuclease BN (tRNA processing enzyme)